MAVKFDIMNLVVQSDRHFASIYLLSKCHLPHIQYSHKQYHAQLTITQNSPQG